MNADAAAPLRTFISFADRKGEREFVRVLLPRLNDQPLHVWNYHGEREEIPGGAVIGEHLLREIDTCEAFLPIVSPNTFQSTWVAHEVAHALGMHNEHRIKVVPIVSSTLAVSEPWPKPFDGLRALRSRRADFQSMNVEELVADLCHDLGVTYRPLFPEHYRFPYRARFQAEIYQAYEQESAKPRRADRERAVFEVLLRLLGQFGAAISAERHADALRIMQLFCLTCEHEYPGLRLYYPYVARGTCELLAGNLANGEQTFRGLLGHEKADESTFGALGIICLERGEYEEALMYYQRARSRRPTDAAAMHGEIICRIRLKMKLDLEQAFQVLDNDGSVDGRDRDKVHELKALALKNAGQLLEAANIYGELISRGVASPDARLEFADLLQSMEMVQQAREVLTPMVGGDHVDIAITAARLAAYCGNFAEAKRLWFVLLEREPRNRQYLLELARLCWDFGKCDSARELLGPLTTASAGYLPQTNEDFYCDGAAQWVCGDPKLAEYDFQRSGFGDELHYRHIFV